MTQKEGMLYQNAYPLFLLPAQEKQQGYPKPQV